MSNCPFTVMIVAGWNSTDGLESTGIRTMQPKLKSIQCAHELQHVGDHLIVVSDGDVTE